MSELVQGLLALTIRSNLPGLHAGSEGPVLGEGPLEAPDLFLCTAFYALLCAFMCIA
jgi:hypothetical protein